MVILNFVKAKLTNTFISIFKTTVNYGAGIDRALPASSFKKSAAAVVAVRSTMGGHAAVAAADDAPGCWSLPALAGLARAEGDDVPEPVGDGFARGRPRPNSPPSVLLALAIIWLVRLERWRAGVGFCMAPVWFGLAGDGVRDCCRNGEGGVGCGDGRCWRCCCCCC